MHILFKNSGQKILALFLCLLLTLSGSSITDAAKSSDFQTAKAGIFFYDGYHMKDKNGNLSGYGIEFLKLASQYSHINFTYTGYDKSWSSMLDMLENGSIDILTSAQKTPEQVQKFAFSLPIGKNNTVLSVQAEDSRFHSGSYESYNGMTVGVLSTNSQDHTLKTFAEKKGFACRTKTYDDPEKLAEALQKGRVDAILSSSLRKTKSEKILDTIASEDFYAIVRKEDTDLLNEINYAIEQMNLNEGDWSNVLYYKYYGPDASSVLSFTAREKAYMEAVISGRKSITAAAIRERRPYSFVQDHELKGILPDYFAEVMKVAGLPYETVIPKDFSEYSDFVSSNSIDVIIDSRSFDQKASDNDRHGFYTDAYLTAGAAKVTRKDFTGRVTKAAVADPQGGDTIEQTFIEDAEVLYYPSSEQAMQAVLNGTVDAAYVYTNVAQLFVNNELTDSLNYSIMDGIFFDFRMYVRDSCDHELVTILNKCIKQVPDDILDQHITKYTSYDPEDMSFLHYMQLHPHIMFIITLLLVIIIGIILALYLRSRWNKQILDAAEQSNKKLGEQLAIVDALSRDYLNVFSIDADSETARIIKLKGYVTQGLNPESKKDFSYSLLIRQYIKDRVYEEDQPYLTEALALDKVKKVLAAETEYTGTYRVPIDQEIHNFQFIYMTLPDQRKNDTFILAGFRNIDEMVRREQEQKEILAEALAEAQHANHAKTVFLNNMSHDIRTPMNAIIGFTSLASTHIDNKEQVQDYLSKIMTSGSHLLSLINDVLDMSRIESGKVKINEKETSLPEIMHDLKTIVQADVKAKQLEFSMDTLDVTDEIIICDKLRLNQVLLNILSNAMKYTDPGGAVSIRIIQTDSAAEGMASYQFKIKDTGIGMSQEFLSHLFEPFEREQTATTSSIQGTGLGLAITKNIVDMMNGTISVESEEGRGTEFTVSFQFRTAENPAETECLSQLADLHALIVDDDVNTCTSVSKMLSSIGMRPDWTTRGKEAVIRTEFAIEQKDPFRVYIIDWIMPDLNGIEIVRRIRKIVDASVPIIILSAYDWADIEEEAIEAGVTAFCSKPIFLSELRRILIEPYTPQQTESRTDSLGENFAGRKILLVEDNEINQEIARTILEEEGFIVDTVDNGSEAVEQMKQVSRDTYDLILMDVQMPIMNGYEAARTIRAMDDPVKSAIPIIAMTANAFEEDKQLALDAGMNSHIAKPIDVDNLFQTLDDILKGLPQ